MEETKTGFPIPGEVAFVEYMGKQVKKSAGNKKGKVRDSGWLTGTTWKAVLTELDRHIL